MAKLPWRQFAMVGWRESWVDERVSRLWWGGVVGRCLSWGIPIFIPLALPLPCWAQSWAAANCTKRGSAAPGLEPNTGALCVCLCENGKPDCHHLPAACLNCHHCCFFHSGPHAAAAVGV